MITDLNGQLTALQLCAKRVAVGAGTQTFAGVDLKDYIGNCKLAITHNELSGSGATSIVYSLLDSADNTTFAASAYLPTPTTTTAAAPMIEIALDTRNCKQYVQLKALTSSTTATFDVAAVLVGCKQIIG
jgi:hypothetical protein